MKQINTGSKPRDSLRKLGRSDLEKIESKDDETRFEPTDVDVADDDKNDDDDDNLLALLEGGRRGARKAAKELRRSAQEGTANPLRTSNSEEQGTPPQ